MSGVYFFKFLKVIFLLSPFEKLNAARSCYRNKSELGGFASIWNSMFASFRLHYVMCSILVYSVTLHSYLQYIMDEALFIVEELLRYVIRGIFLK